MSFKISFEHVVGIDDSCYAIIETDIHEKRSCGVCSGVPDEDGSYVLVDRYGNKRACYYCYDGKEDIEEKSVHKWVVEGPVKVRRIRFEANKHEQNPSIYYSTDNGSKISSKNIFLTKSQAETEAERRNEVQEFYNVPEEESCTEMAEPPRDVSTAEIVCDDYCI